MTEHAVPVSETPEVPVVRRPGPGRRRSAPARPPRCSIRRAAGGRPAVRLARSTLVLPGQACGWEGEGGCEGGGIGSAGRAGRSGGSVSVCRRASGLLAWGREGGAGGGGGRRPRPARRPGGGHRPLRRAGATREGRAAARAGAVVATPGGGSSQAGGMRGGGGVVGGWGVGHHGRVDPGIRGWGGCRDGGDGGAVGPVRGVGVLGPCRAGRGLRGAVVRPGGGGGRGREAGRDRACYPQGPADPDGSGRGRDAAGHPLLGHPFEGLRCRFFFPCRPRPPRRRSAR